MKKDIVVTAIKNDELGMMKNLPIEFIYRCRKYIKSKR